MHSSTAAQDEQQQHRDCARNLRIRDFEGRKSLQIYSEGGVEIQCNSKMQNGREDVDCKRGMRPPRTSVRKVMIPTHELD
jgi:hypothetical protein